MSFTSCYVMSSDHVSLLLSHFFLLIQLYLIRIFLTFYFSFCFDAPLLLCVHYYYYYCNLFYRILTSLYLPMIFITVNISHASLHLIILTTSRRFLRETQQPNNVANIQSIYCSHVINPDNCSNFKSISCSNP